MRVAILFLVAAILSGCGRCPDCMSVTHASHEGVLAPAVMSILPITDPEKTVNPKNRRCSEDARYSRYQSGGYGDYYRSDWSYSYNKECSRRF